MNWKRLTSTSSAKLDVNMDALAYIDRGAHGGHDLFPGTQRRRSTLSPHTRTILAFTPLGLIPESQQALKFLVAANRSCNLVQTSSP